MNEKLSNLRIVAATGNSHKLQELSQVTSNFGIHLISKAEAGVENLEVEETGSTFEENSRLKAEVISNATGLPAISDDSGLMVDALSGAPGVFSARFSGEHATDEDNKRKLLSLLKDVPEEKRTAQFVSVITLVFPDGTCLTAKGECPGHILFAPAGENGFGYDPLFVPDGFTKSFAQLSADEKNAISHRGLALQALYDKLQALR